MRHYCLAFTMCMAPYATDGQRDAMIEAGTEMVLEDICGSESCRENHYDRVEQAVTTVIDVCIEEATIPVEHCLSLVAVLRESNAKAYPTCAPQACNDMCGVHPTIDRKCRMECAKQVSPRTYRRVERCNDRGTSAGWFQMKVDGAHMRACEKAFGHKIDPHDLDEVSRCYALRVRQSAKKNFCRAKDPWPIAFARVGIGVFKRGTREPVCEPNRYAKRGAAAWSACEGCK